MKKRLTNIWVTLALMLAASVAFYLLKYIGTIVVFLIVLALIPVAIDLFFGLLTFCGIAVAWIALLLWGRHSASR